MQLKFIFLLFVLLCFPWGGRGGGSVLKLYNMEVLKRKIRVQIMANDGCEVKRENRFLFMKKGVIHLCEVRVCFG